MCAATSVTEGCNASDAGGSPLKNVRGNYGRGAHQQSPQPSTASSCWYQIDAEKLLAPLEHELGVVDKAQIDEDVARGPVLQGETSTRKAVLVGKHDI